MLIRDISDFGCALALFICFCDMKQRRNEDISNVRSEQGRSRFGKCGPRNVDVSPGGRNLSVTMVRNDVQRDVTNEIYLEMRWLNCDFHGCRPTACEYWGSLGG